MLDSTTTSQPPSELPLRRLSVVFLRLPPPRVPADCCVSCGDLIWLRGWSVWSLRKLRNQDGFMNLVCSAVALHFSKLKLLPAYREILFSSSKSPLMERYKFLKELGDGTCGTVYKAINMETYEIVAVKKMKKKFYFWEECMNLREVRALRKLNHPNIIKLKEVVSENDELFFIFEYMEYNLYQLMREHHRPFSEEEIRRFMSQVMQGLAYMHRNGYFHRDLKPENLLVTDDLIKIADFGLAREVTSMSPYTDYVSTRWYRAPEVLLQSSTYTPAIDMWAVGAILAELFILCPIFPGVSEIDQLYKICCVLGTPDMTKFHDAMNVSRLISISHSEILHSSISDIIPNASSEAIDLITKLCSWDPLRRPTAEESLQHPFFHLGMAIPHSLSYLPHLELNKTRTEPNLELNLWDFGTKQDDCFLGLTLAVKPSISNLEICHEVSQVSRKDMLFCSGFQDHSEHSVSWSLFPSYGNESDAREKSSLTLALGPIPNRIN